MPPLAPLCPPRKILVAVAAAIALTLASPSLPPMTQTRRRRRERRNGDGALKKANFCVPAIVEASRIIIIPRESPIRHSGLGKLDQLV